MKENQVLDYLKDVLQNMPNDWLALTTHRLDIYTEELAKTQFLEQLEALFRANRSDTLALSELPTAFDYIRLGHPLSCLLEWAIASINRVDAAHVVSFSSETMPALAVLRKNSLEQRNTLIAYTGELPKAFDADLLHQVYNYQFELRHVAHVEEIGDFEGSTVFISEQEDITALDLPSSIDFSISTYPHLGSVIIVNGKQNHSYISEIQHVRRRESIAMTPADCLTALQCLTQSSSLRDIDTPNSPNKAKVLESIQKITGTATQAQIGSSGLSIQYAIMMGLVHHAQQHHAGKDIKFIVPPNCYGGTNDQARRVAACLEHVEVMDLPVDREHDMVQSTDLVLEEVAKLDAVPYIIAEIPTNPRVEVPDLMELQKVLSKERTTPTGTLAIDPVFILDQTFCPNVEFLGEDKILADVRAISYVSGSKFPSGGKCTAGYCVANKKAADLLQNIEVHLQLCDNEATGLQLEILAQQLPSMNQRIKDAYQNTREFVDFIEETLPEAKINFVSEELAAAGFTPSVFSLDLPTKGDTEEAKEAYKRDLNNRLINLMIQEIPKESKYCVSYGQLKGCYWTIPATSTQGTTKESDKDYIARVSLSPNMDLARHKQVFQRFVEGI